MRFRTICAVLLLAAVPQPAAAQTDACLTAATQSFNVWLNCRVERVLARVSGPSGNEKQAEAPSVSDDAPSLVDTSSASDFIGVGMTLLGLRNSPASAPDAPPASPSDVTSGATSITVTGFALLAAGYGKDPLADRDFYYDHSNWRRASFTIGRQPKREAGTGLNAEGTIVGAKLLLLDLREIAKEENLGDVVNATDAAAISYARTTTSVIEMLRTTLEPTTTLQNFSSSLSMTFRDVLAKAATNEELSKKIDAVIEASIASEVALRDAVAAKIMEIKSRPQVSVAWSGNLRNSAAPDQHRLEVIVDYGMAPRLNVTANAGIDVINSKTLMLPAGIDQSAGRVAGALKLVLGDAGVYGIRPVTAMTVSANLTWKNSEANYKAQWKFDLPVSGGIVLPISLTWANKRELIEEKGVRGTIGFTIDTSKLASFLR